MREIKFRAMIVGSDGAWIAAQGNGPEIDTPAKFLALYGENELMQYTGLKDKNGVEIYEGDILQVTNEWSETTMHRVAWGGEDYPAFDLKPTLSDELNSLCEIACGDYQYRVIGNIYENPEILRDAS